MAESRRLESKATSIAPKLEKKEARQRYFQRSISGSISDMLMSDNIAKEEQEQLLRLHEGYTSRDSKMSGVQDAQSSRARGKARMNTELEHMSQHQPRLYKGDKATQYYYIARNPGDGQLEFNPGWFTDELRDAQHFHFPEEQKHEQRVQSAIAVFLDHEENRSSTKAASSERVPFSIRDNWNYGQGASVFTTPPVYRFIEFRRCGITYIGSVPIDRSLAGSMSERSSCTLLRGHINHT